MEIMSEKSTLVKTQYIRKSIISHVKELRGKYRFLKYQNVLGLSILLFSLLGCVASSILYINGQLPWWACIFINAFFISITQEIEHDLIHKLYFPKNRGMHHLMIALAWAVRPGTANPWVRRKLHLKHHQISGTEEDLEERALTNGFRWSLFRIYMMGDLMVASNMLLLHAKTWKEKMDILWIGFKSYFPVTLLTWFLWYFFVAFHLSDWIFSAMGRPVVWSDNMSIFVRYLNVATVTLIAPNILWTFCLHFISSNMHYYGDIERGNVIQQTQVLNTWWLWPFHIFCFNFGSTHSIHHFVVNEPFYIRQMSAKVAHQAMKDMGVRFNDFGTFTRSNRWSYRARNQPADRLK